MAVGDRQSLEATATPDLVAAEMVIPDGLGPPRDCNGTQVSPGSPLFDSDDYDCGLGGADCTQTGQVCRQGACVASSAAQLAMVSTIIGGLTSDAAGVIYYTNGPTILSCDGSSPLACVGTQGTLFTGTIPQSFSTAAGYLYFLNGTSADRCLIASCTSTMLTYHSFSGGTFDVAAGSTNAYFNANGALADCPLAGCPASGPTTLAAPGGAAGYIAIDRSTGDVLFTDSTSLNRYSTATGATQIFTGTKLGHLAVDAANVYVTDTATGQVFWLPLAQAVAGAMPKYIVQTPDTHAVPLEIASDGSAVFWVNSGDSTASGAILKASVCELGSLNTHPPVVLAPGEMMPRLLTVTRGSVYWVGNQNAVRFAPQ
jgi:hypothetical protein